MDTVLLLHLKSIYFVKKSKRHYLYLIIYTARFSNSSSHLEFFRFEAINFIYVCNIDCAASTAHSFT